jgi:hypothetical protein
VPIALDGKTLRGALHAKATAAHPVSVFVHRARLVLHQLAVTEKSNEIPCVRALLKMLPRVRLDEGGLRRRRPAGSGFFLRQMLR